MEKEVNRKNKIYEMVQNHCDVALLYRRETVSIKRRKESQKEKEKSSWKREA